MKRILSGLIVGLCAALLGGGVAYSSFSFDTPLYGDSNPVSIQDAADFFSQLHQESELWHMSADSTAPGSWESYYYMYVSYKRPKRFTINMPPWVPNTGRRVIAYIQASHVDGANSAIYLERARQGLGYLCSVQKPDGRFEREDNLYPMSSLDEVYDTAIAGRALLEGYREFRNSTDPALADLADTCLVRSQRAADWLLRPGALQTSAWCDPADANWAVESPLEALVFFDNANYLGFIAWHLAALYEETGAVEYLEGAISAVHDIMNCQDSDGTWQHYRGTSPDAIEKKMAYHSITLRGLLETYHAIKGNPDYAAFQDSLEASINSAINYMIDQQGPYGRLREDKDGGDYGWVSGLDVLSLAHEYLDLDPVNRERLESLIFALARNIPQFWGYGGYVRVVGAWNRIQEIVAFGQYLHSTVSGTVYPGMVWEGTIRITGDVTVPEGVTLTTPPAQRCFSLPVPTTSTRAPTPTSASLQYMGL